MTAAKMMHQTKMMILLSLNAVVILIVGVMIFSAINLNGGIEFKVVAEHSDMLDGGLDQLELLAPGFEELAEPPAVIDQDGGVNPIGNGGSQSSSGGSYVTGSSTSSSGGIKGENVARGELWEETAITIFQTADFDICVGGGLSGLGDMYWQTSNPAVIKGFINSARTWLGYSSETCRYPVIVGTGTTVITAGTYDGSRYDKITVTVIEAPAEQWKRDVLNLVNQERAKNGLAALAWGTTCEAAANMRARELIAKYAHTRPDGAAWSTACPVPTTGGKSGENLAAGNSVVSPATVVASWMNSPDHRKNILDPDFKYLSVGFVYDPNSAYKTYWSQYFTTY